MEGAFGPILQHRGDKAAEGAKGIDQRDTRCCRAAGQVAGRKGPEHRLHGDEAGSGEAQGDDSQQWAGHTHRAGDPDGRHQQGQRGGTAALAGAVAVTGNQVGRAQGADPRNCRDQPHHQPDLAAQQTADLGRQVKHHAIDAGLDEQVNQAQVQHRRLAQHAEQAAAVGLFVLVLGIEQRLDLPAFFDRQPFSIGGAVVQVPIGPDAHSRSHQAFNGEQPLPAVDTDKTVQLQQQARQRAAEDERQRRAEVEEAHGLAPGRRGEPIGEVEDDTGKEPGFGHAQQEAQHVETRFVVGKDHGRRHQAPGHHDPAHPQPGTDAVQDQVARHLQQGVAGKEHPGAKGERCIADTGVGLEGLLGEPDVGAVEKGHDVHQQQEGQQAPGNLGQHRRRKSLHRGVPLAGICSYGLDCTAG